MMCWKVLSKSDLGVVEVVDIQCRSGKGNQAGEDIWCKCWRGGLGMGGLRDSGDTENARHYIMWRNECM